MIKPSIEDITALIKQAEKLIRELEQLKKKSFLTPIQSESIKPGTDTALYLLRLSYTNEKECWSNFGIVDSYFTPTDSLKSGRFAQNLRSRYSDDYDEKPERIEWYNPNKHKGLFVRYDFDKKKFHRFLNQSEAKQRRLYWKKLIQPLINRLDTDLTPWLPFMKSYINTEGIQKAIKTADSATLSDIIYEFKKIQKVVEVEKKQELAGRGENVNDEDIILPPAQEKAYQSYWYAIKKCSEIANKKDKDVYLWLKENGPADYDLPSFNTWSRYVRDGRKLHGTHKNSPRAGRETKVPKANDDPDLIQQISNQYTKSD